MICKTLVFSDHAINQMFKCDILVEDVKQVIETGEVINIQMTSLTRAI